MARTVREGAMLARDLDGYRDYREKVRYRLFPFIR
jgi:protein-S-isoprenylcysteine O-methyltransferase Ste14